MKKNVGKRVLAFILSGALVLGMMHAPMNAEAGETIYGNPETIDTTQQALGRDSDFNEGWKFYLGTSSTAQNQSFDDSGWDVVDLPHDFSISQNFASSGEAESGFLPGGTGWYRKAFTLSKDYDGKTIIINFDGVYSDAYVYVNGTLVGENHYGYNCFAFDITEYVECDGTTENIIAVKAVNNIPSSRWYSGSGIYRDVTLSVVDPVHVDLNGTYVTTPNIESGNGTVNVQVDVVNDGTTDAEVTVTNTITKKGGDGTVLSTTSETVTVGAAGTENETKTVTTTLTVSSPELWSVDTPNLYEVHTILGVDGKEVDQYDTTFGFRYFSFDSTGFHLNGENVKLKGVCMHHDQGALGAAAYYDAIYRQMSIMKDMGCNAIRVTHNPASKELIEICDELGLLVIEELFDGWKYPKNGNNNDFSAYFEQTISSSNKIYGGNSSMTWAEFVTNSVVKRDKNAASIIAWSICNEVQEGCNQYLDYSGYPNIANNIITWIKKVDTTRPATIGDNTRGGNSNLIGVINNITNSGGIAGFNYAKTADDLNTLTNNYAGDKGVIIASETASATNSRGIYVSQTNNSSVDGKYHLTSYDTSAVGWGLTAHDSIWNTFQNDCVAGEFVWTGFDYIGEPTPWNGTSTGTVEGGSGATPNSSYFGIVETTGFEKDTYYLYRSQWNQKDTTLHLVTAWDSDNMLTNSGKTPVWIYSNAPYVELYRGETLIGTATREDHTTAAGHTYYTYITASNDSGICAVESATGADSLYAVFNVAFEEGTIRAKAFEEDETTPIVGTVGKSAVTTPGTVSKLSVTSDVQNVEADGESLIYVAVDVLDANNNLDTTATNNIQFTVTGPGVILGVDNGDQATVNKYQQDSVLTSDTTANINAYAGKALAIVKSTKEAGNITIDVSATGLTGGSVTLASTEVGDNEVVESGLVRYTMVRDYSVKVGTEPTLEPMAVTGVLGDGTSIEGTVVWSAVDSKTYNTAGDYTISGNLSFPGMEDIPVSGRLHVIPDVVVMRNVSVATALNTIPTLPDKVAGVLFDATVAGEFAVKWETMATDQFANVGDIVEIDGVATVFGTETMPVKAFVRVAEVEKNTEESTNVAPQASGVAQDIPSNMQSDTLASITDGEFKVADSESTRWSNWKNRYTSDTATITLSWDTAQLISDINLYYRYDNACKKPASVVFKYSLNGVDFTEIGATETGMQDVSVNYGAAFAYALDKPINPVAIQIVLTQQGGTSSGYCVGLYEVEAMTFVGAVDSYSSADLTGISVDGTPVQDFDANNTEQVYGNGEGTTVTATGDQNAAVTILPPVNGVVRILTLAEDGIESKVYSVSVAAQLEVANATISAHTTEQGQITVIGQFEDYENKGNYFTVTNRGLLFYETARLGSKALTVNTEGRTKINFSAYYEEADGEHEVGSFWYHKTPATESMKYTVRAFLEYVDASGNKKYVYSEPLIVAYDLLQELEAELAAPTE